MGKRNEAGSGTYSEHGRPGDGPAQFVVGEVLAVQE